MALNIEELQQLYFDGTKHSNYQNIPGFVQETLGYSVKLDEQWRGDTARYTNLLQNVDFENLKIIGDIGANTGFFSLSIGERYPAIKVRAYEANSSHSAFIQSIVTQFNLQNVSVQHLSVDMQGIGQLGKHDCILNYNVLHHAGVDYDKGMVDPETFQEYAVRYLGKLSEKSARMVFQMGYNWGGNKNKPLVELNDDAGKVHFMNKIFIKSGWKIGKVFTVQKSGVFEYMEMPAEIILAMNDNSRHYQNLLEMYFKQYQLDQFSEFYRRPIFYCSSDRF